MKMLFLIVAAVLAAISPLPVEAAPPAAAPASAAEVAVTPRIGKDGVQRVEITGGEFFFRPERIVVKVNVPVELSVRKEGHLVPHTIVMNHPEAGMAFGEKLANEPKIIRFTPLKSGTYTFFCDKKPPLLKSHRDRGMEGTLEVVE